MPHRTEICRAATEVGSAAFTLRTLVRQSPNASLTAVEFDIHPSYGLCMILKKYSQAGLAALMALALTACTALNLDSTPPQGYDLSGTWLINPQLSDPPPVPRRGGDGPAGREKGARGPAPSGGGGQPQMSDRSSRLAFAFLIQDFPILAAQRLKIEQNRDSMGIDFDRGSYRDVSWGERERGIWDVTAGWDETGVLTILSESTDARALERLQLSEDERQLSIEFSYQVDGDSRRYRRVFDRFQ